MTSCILPIPNERQTQDGMCWCAALTPIVAWCSGRSITQRELCAAAGRAPDHGATTDDMARALRRAARISSYPTNPISAEATFKILTDRKPIVLVLDVGRGFVAHCATLRGMVRDGHEWSAVINEPNLNYSLFVPFARVRAAWREGLIIQGRS